MKKIIVGFIFLFTCKLCAISTTMNHRLVSSAPLLYKQLDYAHEDLSIEFEPWISQAFDPDHTISNLTPQGKISLHQATLGCSY